MGNFFDLVVVVEVLRICVVDFVLFEIFFWINFYDIVYCMIGGYMCLFDLVMFLEFMFYYGFIDKIWMDW